MARLAKSTVRMEVREELVRSASQGKTVTYGHLMKKFKISRGHPTGAGIARVIGAIGRYENARGAPGFGAIVVRKDTGYPGGGYFCYDDTPPDLRRPKERGANPMLSEHEKRHIRGEQVEIWRYYSKKAAGRPGTVEYRSRGTASTD